MTDTRNSVFNTDHYGNNRMHYLLGDMFITPSLLLTFLKLFSASEISTLSRQVNNDGLLPFDFINFLPQFEFQKDYLRSIILPYMTENPFKNPREQISIDELQSYLTTTNNAKTKKNLEEAVEAINFARRSISHSQSHFYINNLDNLYKYIVNEETTLIRNVLDNEVVDYHYYCYINNQLNFHTKQIKLGNKLKLPNSLFKSTLDLVEKCIIKNAVVNCDEYALVALSRLLKANIPAELYCVTGHTFVVIDRDPKSDPKNPETWGPSAVICDPWTGIAYQAAEFKTKLHSRTEVSFQDNYYNIASPYNPAFHRIDLNYSYQYLDLPFFMDYCKRQDQDLNANNLRAPQRMFAQRSATNDKDFSHARKFSKK